MSQTVVKGVAVIVFNNTLNKVLLLQRGQKAPHSQGVWENTGGHVEPGEALVDAARREAQEELSIGLVDLQPLYEKVWFAEHKQKTYQMQIYTAQIEGTPKLNEPDIFQAFGWFDKAQLQQLTELADYAKSDFEYFGWL